jgi:hypothetical protein
MSSIPIVPDNETTGFPFNYSRTDYAAELEYRSLLDLIAQVESWQTLALKVADDPDGSRAYCEMQLEAMVAELESRQRLFRARQHDPLRPTWPTDTDALQGRIDAVKAAWPMERFCRELLRMELTPTGSGRFKGHCPMIGHKEQTPSFIVYPDDRAWCFGCSRGGDVITIAQYILNLDRFIDALRKLEGEGVRS